MLYRVKQFFKGVTASDDGIEIIYKYLNQDEVNLFMKLPIYERRHAIDTAKTIQKFDSNVDKDVLVKAALLHDIGKVNSGIGLIKKSILVLMNKYLPYISHLLAHRVKMFYVYYNHNIIGAEMLRSINTLEYVTLLVEHHQPWDNFQLDGLELLKRADNLN